MNTSNLSTKDLMIGDWVSLSKGYWSENRQVELIDIEMIAESVYFATPIPLTPEILEKNGFKRDPFWHHCDKDFGDYTICVQLGYANKIEYIKIAEKGVDDVIPSERTKMYLTHIKYVHELQRALRLCGIEKEIEEL